MPKRNTSESIERAALELFWEQGYERVTVAEIAAAAGVSRATFFRYFGSKEVVVFASQQRELEALRQKVRRHRGAAFDPEEFAAALVEWVSDFEARDETLSLRVRLMLRHEELQGAGLIARDNWAQAVAEELTDGPGPPDLETQVLAASAMGAVFLALKRWQDRDERRPLPDLLNAALADIARTPRR